MLNLPVYLRGSTYYLHCRVHGRQFKRSLNTADKTVAIMRAARLLEAILVMDDIKRAKKYEIDLGRGIFKADGPEDHAMLLEAIGRLPDYMLQRQVASQPVAIPAPPPPASHVHSLTLVEVLDKFLLLKKVKPATATAYKNTVKEFVTFHQSRCAVLEILPSDFVRYQEHLAVKGNTSRTIDNKITNLKSVLNFAADQGYISKNPIQVKNLQSKKQKMTEGYLIFEPDEVNKIFTCDYFKAQKRSDPDYYYCLLLEIFSGCRIAELTSLTKGQIKQSAEGTWFIQIRDSKTVAGRREIPLPEILFTDLGFSDFIKHITSTDTVFRYVDRTGKGSGNAVGKKFARHLQEEGIDRGKLVFHSLRKFVNDFFMKNGVDFEPRCQFMGHEIDSVNVATYAKKFNVDELYRLTENARAKVLALVLG